ncbi:MAG: cation:proton antiporter [Gaiella sp.]
MDVGFAEALVIVGGLLLAAAALSGWLRGTVLSISVLSVSAGLVLAWTGVVAVDASATSVLYVVELALLLTLFADGLVVERELLREHWTPTALALVLAMPLTLALLAVAAKTLFPALSWSEAFLLGAVLSPTDPVVTSAVVTSERVPAKVRHTLNLESGLNDGLALPFVLFFLALAIGADSPGGEAARLAGETIAGAAIGIVLAVAGARLLPRLPGGGIEHKYEGVYALGLAFLAFGIAEQSGWANGLIAVFVAGIALAVVRHALPDDFLDFNESLSAVLQVVTFTLFGALIFSTGWDGPTTKLVVFIAFALLVARPLAVLVAFIPVREPRSHKLFMAWFGPKGVASMLFALLVLSSTERNRTLVFDVASFTVIASIVAHGLTDTVGSNWLVRRMTADGATRASRTTDGETPL